MGKGDAVVLDGRQPAEVLHVNDADVRLLFPSGTRCTFDRDRVTPAP
jgi:preprotein translocase subunit YajC